MGPRGPRLGPRSPQNKVSRFLTSKPGEASGLLATWRTSKRGVEKKKIKPSSLVAKGFAQVQGLDFGEMFAPVA
ncbi:hypothetical protein U9M48_003712 [Paspalum notatum var. saurae]|uniref:Reverse transcriptase Ty1/copia-type domain-containing protein n=1 Tax=Paspalum notatum var. saurae TaxID=547442 RepID=A0AAQ3PJ47_PASNO